MSDLSGSIWVRGIDTLSTWAFVGHYWPLLVVGSVLSRGAVVSGKQLSRAGAAKRRGIGVADLADRDRAWTGRGGKRFCKAVAGLPTAVFDNRMCAQAHCRGIGLYALNPAYSSAWGDRHWRAPDENVTRPQAAATVIGRRAQDFRACR